MDLRLLRAFLTTADAGTVSRAASELSITQPALSRQLQKLERSWDVELFHRQKGRLHLTAAGHALLTHVRLTLQYCDDLENLARAIARGRLDSLTIAAPPTTLSDIIAPFVATLSPDDPHIALMEWSPRGANLRPPSEADLVIVPGAPSGATAAIPVAVLPVWAQMLPSDPMTHAPDVDIADLIQHPLIAPGADIVARRLLDAAVVQAGLDYRALTEAASPRVAQALAAAGRGVAVVTDDVRFGLEARPIKTENGHLEVHLHASWDPTHHAAVTLDEFAQRIRDYTANRYAG